MEWASSILGAYNNGPSSTPTQVSTSQLSPIKQIRSLLSLSGGSQEANVTQKPEHDTPLNLFPSNNRGEDGRGWVTQLSDSVIFHVSLGYNMVRHNRETQPWWDEITDGIILGALPFHDRDHRTKLIELGVGGVVILCKDYELSKNFLGTPVTPSDWNEANVETLHLPTQDFTAPTDAELQSAVDFMTRIIKDKKKVYVHCKAGRGRSVACVVCYCIVHLGMSAQESVAFIHKKRSHINMGAGQFKACQDFEMNHRKQTTTTADDSSPSSSGIAGSQSTVPSIRASCMPELSESSESMPTLTSDSAGTHLLPTTTISAAPSPSSSESSSTTNSLVASATETDFVFVGEEEWLAAQEDALNAKRGSGGEGGECTKTDDDDWEEVRPTSTSDCGYGVGVDELVQSHSFAPFSARSNLSESNRLEGVEDFEVISKRDAASSSSPSSSCDDERLMKGSQGSLVSNFFKNARNLGSAIASYTTTPATTTTTVQTTKTHASYQWPPVVQEQYTSSGTSSPVQSEIGQKLSPSSSPRSSSAWNPISPPPVEVSQM